MNVISYNDLLNESIKAYAEDLESGQSQILSPRNILYLERSENVN